MRLPSEAFKEIASQEQEGKIEKNRLGCFQMGIALIKIKIMPTGIEVSLDEIKEKTKTVLEDKSAEKIQFSEEAIAFGLKAVIAGFELDESKELEPIEEELQKINDVNSVEVIDMRRAFG